MRKAEASGLASVFFTAWVAALLLIVIPPVWAALLVLPRGRGPSRLLRGSVRLVLRVTGCRVRARGIDRLDACEPVVVVANHGSYLDSIMLMAALPPGYLFVVNHAFASIPFFGLAVRKAGHIVVDRTRAAARRACMLEMIDALRRGTSLVVFPEGTRHRGAELLPFRLGAFRAAVEAGRPVIPTTVLGTTGIWAPGTWLMHRGSVDIVAHDAVDPLFEGRSEITRLRDRARADIERGLAGV
jgi:1-acyl-sn-glycerol-3-phosphate acyltransferase